ncbi:MAG: murein transglycosylase A [Rhizobiaceae bacterium]
MLDSSANPTSGLLEHYKRIEFSLIDGWMDDDHAAAMACFRVTARKLLDKEYQQGYLGPQLADLANAARTSLDGTYGGRVTNTSAKEFFETFFVPYRHVGQIGTNGDNTIPADADKPLFKGFVTGYFEPEIDASLVKTARFTHPFYSRPPDLVEVDPPAILMDGGEAMQFARQKSDGLVPYFDRAEIDQGALEGKGLEIAWIEKPVDAFFIHIQGSARLRFADGTVRRLSYSAKNGHPYTAVGSILVRNGVISKEQLTMETLRNWMELDQAAAARLMHQNRSFIFFDLQEETDPALGPIGAASVPLTPGRSLAIDHKLFTYGMPVWLATKTPLPGQSGRFRRLMISQDTGSAIKGPARGDIFVGSGYEAGMVAGSIKHACDFIVFMPVTFTGSVEQ